MRVLLQLEIPDDSFIMELSGSAESVSEIRTFDYEFTNTDIAEFRRAYRELETELIKRGFI